MPAGERSGTQGAEQGLGGSSAGERAVGAGGLEGAVLGPLASWSAQHIPVG